MIIVLPIEPLTERYSEQWYRKIPEYLGQLDEEIVVIDGEPLLDNEIKVGTFLDINSTTHYKFSQLMALSKMFNEGLVKNNSIIFVMDVEFWGIESVRLLADMNGIKVNLVGFLHAASYTIEDAFSIAKQYQKFTEIGWISAFDKVFVGSSYHRKAVINRRLIPLGAEHLSDRLRVTLNPIFLEEYEEFGYAKENTILLTNRFDKEKRPGNTLKLFRELKDQFPKYKFKVCTGRKSLIGSPDDLSLARQLEAEGAIEILTGLTKREYHSELEKAKFMVSHSIEENYGYCIAEALIYGCIPLLNNIGSHPEFVPPELLFTEQDDYEVCLRAILNEPSVPDLDTRGMDNIIKELSEYR